MPEAVPDLQDHAYYVLPAQPNQPVFGGVIVSRKEGIVLINPAPIARTALLRLHHQRVEKADWVLVTHREHARWGRLAADQVTARLAAPECGRPFLKVAVDRWLSHREELVPGLAVFEKETSAEYGDCDWLLGMTPREPTRLETITVHPVIVLANMWWRRFRRWTRGIRRLS